MRKASSGSFLLMFGLNAIVWTVLCVVVMIKEAINLKHSHPFLAGKFGEIADKNINSFLHQKPAQAIYLSMA